MVPTRSSSLPASESARQGTLPYRWIKVSLAFTSTVQRLWSSNNREDGLDRREALGILEPVKTSKWTAPIVPVKKGDGSIRLCDRYDLTVKVASQLETYPLPRVKELLDVLSGQKFTKIDLKEAYLNWSWTRKVLRSPRLTLTKACLWRNNSFLESNPLQRCFSAKWKPCWPEYLTQRSSCRRHLCDGTYSYRAPGQRPGTGPTSRRRRSEDQPREDGVAGRRGTWVIGSPLQASDRRLRRYVSYSKPVNHQYAGAACVSWVSFSTIIAFSLASLQQPRPRISALAAPMYELEKKGVKWMWGGKQEASFQEREKLPAAAAVPVPYRPDRRLVLPADAGPYRAAARVQRQAQLGPLQSHSRRT